MAKRVFWIVLDSAGCGDAPDAADFGDVGSDTFGSCFKSGLMDVPNMERMGLRNIERTSFFAPKDDVEGCFCRMHEKSMGKDTTVGHWEMAGMVSPKPLPTYYEGFPQEILDPPAQKRVRLDVRPLDKGVHRHALSLPHGHGQRQHERQANQNRCSHGSASSC